MPRVTPSMEARAKWPASKVFLFTPNQTPVPSGTLGVRSPSKYGRSRSPLAPGGARGLVTALEGREFSRQIGINRLNGVGGPFAFADVEQGGAAGVAVLHYLVAREPKIEVIVRQQDGGESAIVFRLMLLEPKNFG